MDEESRDVQEFKAVLCELASMPKVIHDVGLLRGPADRLIEIARRDPESHETYVQLILPLLEEDYVGSWDVVPYLMYRLGWWELRRHAVAKLRQDRWCKLYRLYELIIAADSDNWIELDLWED